MFGNSEGKYTPYHDKKLISICAIAAARWREEFNNPKAPAKTSTPNTAAPTNEPDLSSITREDPAKMPAAKKALLEHCICKDAEINALRKIEFSDFVDAKKSITDNNVLIWEIKPRLLMCLIGPKRDPRKKKTGTEPNTLANIAPKAAPTTSTSTGGSGGKQAASSSSTTKNEYYQTMKDLEWCNAKLEEGEPPLTQADIDRTYRVMGPLIVLRLKAQGLVKCLMESLSLFEVPDNF